MALSKDFIDKYSRLRAERIAGEQNKGKTAPLPNLSDVNWDAEREKAKGNHFDFFDAGAFEDGYQFGDVTKSAVNTTGDVALSLGQGLGNLGEGITDLLLYGASGVADWAGFDEWSEKTKNAAKQNSVDKFFEEARNLESPLFGSVNDNSLLGETSRGIGQGVGQALGIVATGGIGGAAGLSTGAVSALTTGVSFLSSMGGGMTEAYNSNANDKDALLYGIFKGTVDAGSELIFGGMGKAVNALGLSRGISSLDDVFAKKLSQNISNRVVKTLVQGGVKASAEGLEEMLAGLGSAAAKKLTYMSDAELSQLIKDEKLMEQFVTGMFTGGIMQGGDIVTSIKTDTDLITGLTANEQKVFDAEVENRINAKESEGKKVTSKDKAIIYDAVKSDLMKGNISIDTIEEVLGGETYQDYKKLVDSEEALLQEYKDLGSKPKQEVTLAEQSRFDELKSQIDEIKKGTARQNAKTKLGETVYGIAKNDRLSESYNERDRKGQAFQADLSKYDDKQKATVQKAIDSGILNNTNKTHDFVDLVAKLSAEKGISFDFTDNKKLAQSGFALQGVTVNGYVQGGNITLNVNSHKVIETVVGHEVTHILEGTELYSQLQTAVIEYAKTKGDYDKELKNVQQLYKNVDGTDINAELTANLVGDYLFTDADFVNRLSTQNRNLFQKIYAEIKYLCKLATAGSKEARQLEKLKKIFDEAYRSSQQKNTADSGVRYSLTGINQDGIEVYETDQSVIDLPWKERKQKYLDIMQNEYQGRTAKFERNGHIYYAKFDQDSIRKHIYGDSRSSPNGVKALVKTGANGNLFELVENSRYTKSAVNKKDHTDADYFDYFVKTVQIDGKVFDLIADVEKKYANDSGFVYTLALRDNKHIKASPTHGTPNNGPVRNAGNASTNSISQNSQKSTPEGKKSLSFNGDTKKFPVGSRVTYGKDIALFDDDFPIGNDNSNDTSSTDSSTDLSTENDNISTDSSTENENSSTKPSTENGPVVSETERTTEPSVKIESDTEAEETEAKPKHFSRAEYHKSIIDKIKNKFQEKGLDFDNVLNKAKRLSAFSTVDNIPQRVIEKTIGYKEGQILNDLTVNKVAQNETEGIKWLNSFTDRKNGILAQVSKEHNIKPGSKESAAAQMYAEGFYVDKNNNIVEYGDNELAKDFPNAKTRENIKALANNPQIRKIYDDTLKLINESRKRNGYPEIPRLENYYLHFRAMNDTFSRLGLPFNPNDIRAKDLPTDLNGMTADLKPGQPYFSSSNHRTGKRTDFDLLGGLEQYLTSAKNQIYHIDDIQTLRALRNYIADSYGQAKGLENLDSLTEEQAQERIQQVYDSHLSNFAKFLNEEANILAGKTSLIDRGLEGVLGRRGITFLDTLNKNVGSNMVGFNVSSSLTNFVSGVQAIAKTNKVSCIKALAQTVSNRLSSLTGKSDGFIENNPTIIRRKGAERFYRKPVQKFTDAGYTLMSAVDDITTEFIVRAKYDEFVRKKGMDEQQAVIETDKWVSRLMGDRSLGQMPQLYNSKMLGIITKFQLEVRNQLDSQFYDTVQETKVSNEEIKNGIERNIKTAAKVTSTFVQLAVLQHLFGKAFESVAGYNPAFDIIEVLVKTFGLDDEENSEDDMLDNIEQGFLALLEDMPYSSFFLDGGRVPISSALPIEELAKGIDGYGNEKSRLETIGETIPYYLMPTGLGQAKKTIKGLLMFDDDFPIAGSYTDSGNLRFPVEETPGNIIQAALFGQWANENARDYFDNERTPLKEKQIQEFIDSGLTIQEYWDYREGLGGLNTISEKIDYIAGLDIPDDVKNLFVNNLTDRKEPLDVSDYDQYSGYDEFDFAQQNPEKYNFFKQNKVSYEDYQSMDENSKSAYDWAFKNPKGFTLSKAVSDDVVEYRGYTKALSDIKSDKDEDGNTINGSRKEKVLEYINGLDADYGAKIILFKSQYKSDDTYNYDIVDYLNSRNDISYEEMVIILEELGFNVLSDGTVKW